MQKIRFVSLCVWLLMTVIFAAEMPAGVTLKKNGTFNFGEAEFIVKIYNAEWKVTNNNQWYAVKSNVNKNGLVLDGKLKIDNVEGTVSEKITAADGGFHFSARYQFPSPVQMNINCATLFFPSDGKSTVQIDGTDYPLPSVYKDMTVLSRSGVKEVQVRLSEGRVLTVRGALNITIQDNRKFNTENFALRFHASPKNGKHTSAAIDLDFVAGTLRSQSVDLASAATRGFVFDGKSGWTDQGKDNDLRAFNTTEVAAAGLRFAITDPVKNSGKAAVVLGGKEKDNFPNRAAVDLPPLDGAKALCLLHASAWTPGMGVTLGELKITYADKTSEIIPVRSRKDCGNWWNPESIENGNVAWSSENQNAAVGLYVSSFPLKQSNPVKAEFSVAAPSAVWMIVGAVLADGPVFFSTLAERDVYIRAGREWAPLEFTREVIPGSPLDFSWVTANQSPAGKFGRIINRNGRLAFANAPEKRVKLFGANFCFSANYLDKAEVDKLIPRLARIGYNTMRIHHHDTEILDRSAPDTLTFDPKKLDKLDYLFAKLKENGFYITTDLYTNRTFKKGDNIPECTFFNERQMKMLAPVSKAALDNWKEFARRLMTHKNPYTGMTWGEDPALFMLNLVNEENLTGVWANNPASAKIYKEAFARWAAARNLKDARAGNSNRHFRAFLDEIQSNCLNEQLRFCREELKLPTLLTSLNFLNDVPLTLLRQKFDTVDNHSYFDHPSFPERPWSLPYGYRQRCALEQLASVPRLMTPTRIFGKPFIVTEFNYCSPNLHRAEGGPLIGAYPALQDWDALYRFAWSHESAGIVKAKPIAGFDAANDPFAQLLDRIAIAMFVRGDVLPAKEKIAYTVAPDLYTSEAPLNFPDSFSRLGLIAQIGSAVSGVSLPPEVKAIDWQQAKQPANLPESPLRTLWEKVISSRQAVSTTGELALDAARRTFTVVTPRCLSITVPKGDFTAGALAVTDASCFQTITALSLDGKPVAESASVILFHLTNVMNSNALFGNERWTLLKKIGDLPPLVKCGKATVAFTAGKPFKVTALNLNGSHAGEVAVTPAAGKFSFPVDTSKGILVYHLTR